MQAQQVLIRNRINNELSNVYQYPLSIAVAAMGYGKTTAAKDYLEKAGSEYIWLSIEHDESSAQYIWDSLTWQIARTRPELGRQLRIQGFPADYAQTYVIKQIIEEHVYLSNTVLVIDDYHFAHSTAFDKFIESIVRANIEGFHILILSRTIPEFCIAELLLKGYCNLIKNEVFELSFDETKAFLRLYGFDLPDQIVARFCSLSEGWVSATYLIMQQFSETGKLEAGRSIDRLFESAIIPRYSDNELKLLKSLCIFDSFTPQQAVYVTGAENASEILKELSFSNSFIQFEAQLGTFHIHNIFNNYLKKLLEKKPSGIEQGKLFERSGTWCIQNGDLLQGLKYYLKAKKYDLILDEFEKHRTTHILDSSPEFILELFSQIPIKLVYGRPISYISYIGFYVTNVDKVEGRRLLPEVEAYYKNDSEISDEMKKRILGEITLIRAYIAFNDVALMHERFKAAHKLLSGQSYVANKNKIITFGSPHILYLYFRDSGKLQWTVERLEELFPYYRDMSGGCGIGFEYQIRAEYYLETGVLDKAELFAYRAIYKARTLEQMSVIICANLTLMRICLTKGNFDEALEISDALKAEMEDLNSPILSSAIVLSIGYIQGILGNKSGFSNWLREGAIDKSNILYQGVGFNYFVYGKYLLLSRQYIKLEVLVEDMLTSFSTFNNIIGILHAHILDAAAKYKLNGYESALPSLRTALEIGRADRIVLPFAEYSPYILEMLRKLISNSEKDKYLLWVVEFSNRYFENLKLGEAKNSSPVKLSARENQMLKLIAEGKTNRDIASELFIAEVTVRKTLTSIYRKLDTTGRATTVKKAVELGLL